MSAVNVIDCDTHITEPPDLWTARVSAKWGDRIPHVAADDKRADQLAWYIGDKKIAAAPAGAFAGWKEPFPSHPGTYEEAHPASFDARERLRLMDEAGIYAQVLYPNVAGFGSQRFLALKEPELQLECVRAYNDFQIDWIAPAPERFIPIASVPFWDVPAAVQEIERAAAAGHKGMLFTGEPQAFGEPLLGDHHWDPIWSAAQDCGLPISFHIGSGDFNDGFTRQRMTVDGPAATYARVTATSFLLNGMQITDLLFSGVLCRFPELKFVSVESGIGFLPFLLEAADYHFHAAKVGEARPEFEMLPSEYFRRQVYACYWFERVAPRTLLDEIGVGNILFETDFPHPTCLYGNVQETIEAGLEGQPDDVRRRILTDNAAELYGVQAPV